MASGTSKVEGDTLCFCWSADRTPAKCPYSVDGKVPIAAENGFLEIFTALSFIAALTKTIRLGTGICVVPQRNPVYTAKESAAVDWLSNGRLDFGVGVGWQHEEFAAVSMPFEDRGSRCRGFLEVIKRLWCDEVSEHTDAYHTLPACGMYPKPVQSPHPPVFFGGESNAALARGAELGQGWYGLGLNPEDLPPLLSRLDELLARHGRGRADIEIAVSPYLRGCDLAKLERYREEGVDQVILPGLAPNTESIRPTLESLASKLLEAEDRV